MRKIASGLLIVALVAMVALCAAPAVAQGNQTYQQRWFYASDFAQWNVRGQTASTYTWSPGTICNVTANGSATSFFAFSTNAPVEIIDVTPSLSEVVTPSSVTNTPSVCGFAGTVQNTHYSFSVTSGTGGLQETLNAISASNAYPAVVWLDRNWHTLVNNIPTVSAVSIIAAAAGNDEAMLVDNTTSPWTVYTWNGLKYQQALAPTGAWPNLNVTSYTVIPAPTALSTSSTTTGIITTATTGGTLPASTTYRLGATCVDASGGETTMSIDSASTATIETGATAGSTNTVTVTSPGGCTAAAGGVGWRLYASASTTKTEILANPTCSPTFQYPLQTILTNVCPIGSTATITAAATGTSKIPQVNSAYPRTTQTSLAYPPFAATAIAANTSVVPLGTINLPAGYLNSLNRSFELCGVISTVTGTEGDITLTGTITTAGVVGTNSTLFTAAAATTSSTTAPVNIDFCMFFTTAAISTSLTSTAGAIEAHGTELIGLAGTDASTPYQDILQTTVGSLNLAVQDQLAINVIGDGTVVASSIQLRQLVVIPLN